jgi:D-alanyl-D-alanine-carboxypeptidase/D-alanyl-D-alanine-endopeptidase
VLRGRALRRANLGTNLRVAILGAIISSRTGAFVKRRIVALAFIAASQPVWTSQLRSDAELRTILAERLEGFENSVSIIVGVIGPEGRRIVAHGSMGMTDSRPVNGDTLYEIGSITKVFTSLLLADMVEHGEVALDDPVAKYLPAGVKTPGRNGAQITLLDLSTHRSGLPRMPSNFNPKDPTRPYIDYPVERLYEFLSSHELRRDVGAEYEYSNLGAGLLGLALARRAGTDFETALRDRVFRPLGMSSTVISITPALKSRMTTAHSSVFRLAPTPLWDFTPAFFGTGSLRSSANDLLTFLAANLGYVETPLSAAMARMRTIHRDGVDNFKMGLGWQIEQLDGIEMVWKGGASYGSRTFSGFDPKSRAGVVVLSNYNSGSGIDDIGRHALNPKTLVDNGSVVKPQERTAVTLAPEFLDKYSGRYRFSGNEIWTVRRDGTRFFIKEPGEPEFEVFPEGDFAKGNDDFFSKSADALFTFDFAKDDPRVANQLTFRWGLLPPRVGTRIE